ncbi:type VI secretion system tube protein Hcp [Agrobacterium rubi]|nr:type VI secretion system tube protein Hcp [Agrobacterium rubi]MBP1878213.1 type VI protein secretion system component Hcp [Agrobacterium rubi]
MFSEISNTVEAFTRFKRRALEQSQLLRPQVAKRGFSGREMDDLKLRSGAMPIYLEIEGFHGSVDANQYSGCISVNSLEFKVDRKIPNSRELEIIPKPIVSELRMARNSDELSAALYGVAKEGDLGNKAFVHLLHTHGQTDIKFELSYPSLIISTDDDEPSETLSVSFSRIDIWTTVHHNAADIRERWVTGYDLSADRIF